ncbi:winged helix-turn-helix domain-containing protein [candidate division KSB1 bacterium]|nr:winged helix-turn-helix domain-containing protein [candidate division KSB1 bacterium]
MKNSKINELLDKILNSSEFSESKKYQELLTYLVQASLDENIPKEITIAHEVFNVDPAGDSTADPKVRVYIHNLRKKLDSYYIHEGKNDEVQFEIQKGHYEVKFITRKQASKGSNEKTLILINTSFIAVIISLIIFFIPRLIENHKTADHIAADNIIWSDYLSGKFPALLVFGDYYLYKDRSLPNRQRYIRDYQINSARDFEQFLSQPGINPSNLEETNHTLLDKFAPWCLSDLSTVFSPVGQKLELTLSSKLQWEDLNKYNIIFVGSFKTLGLLDVLLSDLNIRYQIYPNSLFYQPTDSDSVFTYTTTSPTAESDYETDYSVIARLPGPNGNTIMIFASTRDIGCLATVSYMTTHQRLTDFVDQLNHQHPPGSPYFVSIFEVQGFERNVVSTKLLHLDHVKPDYRIR